MTKKYKYIPFSVFEKRKKIVCLALILVLMISSIPLSLLISRFADRSATFNVAYLNPDIDYGTLDYTGIEYYMDGVLFTLGATGVVNFVFNDQEVHRFIESLFRIAQNFTIIFGGISQEFLFSNNLVQDVSLDTKSLSSILYWDGLGVIADNMAVDLLWFNGTSWILIQSGTTSAVGLIQFSNLISGEYKIIETGDDDGEISFTIMDSDAVYSADSYIIPDETIVHFEYENSVFGTDYSMDVNSITWHLAYYDGVSWTYTLNPLDFCMSYNVVDGTIIFLELEHRIDGYMIWSSYNGDSFKPIIIDSAVTLDYTAKSGSFEFLWSGDSAPVQNTGMELFYFDGFSWISVGVYITDVNGLIYLTGLIPFGMDFKWSEYTPFNIAVSDLTTYTATYIVDSITNYSERRVYSEISVGMAEIFFFSFFSIFFIITTKIYANNIRLVKNG